MQEENSVEDNIEEEISIEDNLQLEEISLDLMSLKLKPFN